MIFVFMITPLGSSPQGVATIRLIMINIRRPS